MGRHPDHEAVSQEVRSWYTASTPEIGMTVVPTAYGFLTTSDRAERRRVVLTVDDESDVAAALDAAARFYGSRDFEVWVDDRDRAERLHGALVDAGLEPLHATVVLALVGPMRAATGPASLTIEEVDDLDRLREWARVKLQAFDDAEYPPAEERVDADMADRQAEWPVCRYELARLDGAAVAILGHYTGRDQMVFLLATQVAHRHLGIAQALLRHWTQRAASEGDVRSLLINCDDGGRPASLYRRLGFTDEVYWLRRYERRS